MHWDIDLRQAPCAIISERKNKKHVKRGFTHARGEVVACC